MSDDGATTSRTVAEVMIPLRDGCVPMNCAADVLDIVREMAISGMPVTQTFDGGDMLGVVLQSELEKADAEPGGGPRVVDLDWEPARTLRPDTRLDDVPDRRTHIHLVVDEDEGLVGLLETDAD